MTLLTNFLCFIFLLCFSVFYIPKSALICLFSISTSTTPLVCSNGDLHLLQCSVLVYHERFMLEWFVSSGQIYLLQTIFAKNRKVVNWRRLSGFIWRLDDSLDSWGWFKAALDATSTFLITQYKWDNTVTGVSLPHSSHTIFCKTSIVFRPIRGDLRRNLPIR